MDVRILQSSNLPVDYISIVRDTLLSISMLPHTAVVKSSDVFVVLQNSAFFDVLDEVLIGIVCIA